MTQYCPDCNHEFAPEDQNCANCGRSRPPVIQKKYAQILNQADPEDENDAEAVTQPYTVLPAGLRAPAPVQAAGQTPPPTTEHEAVPAPASVPVVSAPTSVPVVPAVSHQPTTVPAPARMETTKFSWSLPDEAELNGKQSAVPAASVSTEEETDANEAKKEAALPTFWTCPQCVSLNPSSEDYCENCGALKPDGTPENRAAAKNPNVPASALPVPPPLSHDPEVANTVQQGSETTKIPAGAVSAIAVERKQPKSTLQVISSSLSDVGISRKGGTNEDSYFHLELKRCFENQPEAFGFYIVADGMGGQAAGEVASRTAIQTIGPQIMSTLAGPWLSGKNFEVTEVADALEEIISAAHTRLFEYNTEEGIDSGTTITACCVIGSQAVFANVGDSRTYLFRPARPKQSAGDITDPVFPVITQQMLDTAPGDRATRKLNEQTDKLKPEVVEEPGKPKLIVERVTRDQSLVQHLVEQGELTIDDVYEDPRRNVILFALGAPDETVPVDTYQRTIESGDMILLCSDGLWEMVRDPAISEILLAQPDADQATQALVNKANENGGADNVTVILVKAI